jgi:hypothetical protein
MYSGWYDSALVIFLSRKVRGPVDSIIDVVSLLDLAPPSGHSAVQASHLGSGVGFEAGAYTRPLLSTT